MEDWNTQKQLLKWKTQDQIIEQYTSDVRLTTVANGRFHCCGSKI